MSRMGEVTVRELRNMGAAHAPKMRSGTQNGVRRNTMMAAPVPVARMLGAPRSGSAYGAHGTRGAGDPRRLQAPAPPGVAVVPVGAGSSPPPADGVRRALRARVRPVAPRRRRGHGQVPRLWHP